MKCENLSLLFIFIYEFIGKTAQPLFSTFFAECNFTELHRVFRYCLLYSLLLGLLATAGVMVWPQVLDLLFGMENIGEVGKAYYAARVFCIGTIFMGVCLLAEGGFSSSWLKKRWLISRKEWQKLPGIPVALVCIWSKVMLLIFFIAAIMDSIH